MVEHRVIEVHTSGKACIDVTARVRALVQTAGIGEGLCNIFVRHTSASVVIQENADPDVLLDLLDWFEAAVEDGASMYRHRDEGPDDMSAHIRSALTATSVCIPICAGQLDLGTWQGIYLFEHRHGPMTRKLVVTLYS